MIMCEITFISIEYVVQFSTDHCFSIFKSLEVFSYALLFWRRSFQSGSNQSCVIQVVHKHISLRGFEGEVW